jgi:2-polyprenyl-3-methyl-5-hydroxy-6-metoxy-1,4-benzoquinol methylase
MPNRKTNKTVMTDKYLVRLPEARKIRLIKKLIKKSNKILDFGCGNGLYGHVLKEKTNILYGLDLDTKLLKNCATQNYYTKLIETTSPPIPFKNNEIDVFFSSEVIEHMPKLTPIIKEVERITKTQIILTMPNPLYSYFYDDPTHILKYSISSLYKDLNRSKKFKYKIQGLGFENIPGPQFLKTFNQFILKPFPSISPTISIIGELKK